MIVLSKKKILDFMSKRKDALYNQITRDFGGSVMGRSYEHMEVKYWKEAIERGEFDTHHPTVFIIKHLDSPEITDFTYYLDREVIQKHVDYLNKIAGYEACKVTPIYSNARNSGEGVKKLAE